jgi:hypothetical protein
MLLSLAVIFRGFPSATRMPDAAKRRTLLKPIAGMSAGRYLTKMAGLRIVSGATSLQTPEVVEFGVSHLECLRPSLRRLQTEPRQ